MENGLDPAVVVPPWLDLPTQIAEEILVRLPLSGYVRFAAVCRQWRSIQAAHRRRHAPSPPPMRSLPWLIPIFHREEAVSCYSPLEDRSYVIRLPSNNGATRYRQLYTHGWLWAEDSGHISLFNPISATRIDLPPLDKGWERSLGSIISPPPNYMVSVVLFPCYLALFRWCDPAWSMFILPPAVPVNTRARRGPASIPMKAIACGGKHYYIFRDGSGLSEPCTYDLLLVDPLPTPTIQFFKMMSCWGKQQVGAESRYGIVTHVVELDGELLLVKEIINNSEGGDLLTTAIGFHVLRADLCRKMWVRVESLGDRVIFVHQHGSVSLLAADVGLKRNCVYFPTFTMHRIDSSGEAPWKVFDLGTGTVADVLIPNATNVRRCSQPIFMPSIC